MLRIILVFWLFLSLFLLSACSPPSSTAPQSSASTPAAQPAPPKISAEEAYVMMNDGAPYLLVDVRTQAEYDAQHISGAVLIPDSEISAQAEAELPDKSARILVYCRSGRRSALAVQTMISMGYTQIYDFGGILDWPYATASTEIQ